MGGVAVRVGVVPVPRVKNVVRLLPMSDACGNDREMDAHAREKPIAQYCTTTD
jgi:hypothetical protein